MEALISFLGEKERKNTSEGKKQRKKSFIFSAYTDACTSLCKDAFGSIFLCVTNPFLNEPDS